MKRKAIACALFYGLVPSRYYEGECHHEPMGYWPHLLMNLAQALRWATGRETEADTEFERMVNADADFRIDRFCAQAGPFILTATAARDYDGLDRPTYGRRRLYLLHRDFRDVRLDLPWSRWLWPRRNMGR
jgi:hypothetical protein